MRSVRAGIAQVLCALAIGMASSVVGFRGGAMLVGAYGLALAVQQLRQTAVGAGGVRVCCLSPIVGNDVEFLRFSSRYASTVSCPGRTRLRRL